MELRQYTSILRRWAWLIILGTVLVGAITYVISRNMTSVYRASATVFVDQATNSNESSYGIIIASERLAQTYAQLMLTRPVVDAVAAQLNLTELKSDVNVEPLQDTQLIQVDVEDSDRELATRIANTLPAVFIQQHNERQLQKFKESRESLDKEIRSLSTNISQVQTKIAELEASNNRTAAQDADLARLRDNLQQYRTSYANLLQSFENLRLTEARSSDTITIVEPAEVPRLPIRPRVLLNTILGLMVGLILSIGAVLLIEYLDDTIKNPDDVTRAVGVSTLGAIPRSRGDTPNGGEEDRPLVTHLSPKAPTSEAYRVLRTNIQFSSLDRPIRTLLVTSANPGEGKSTTASNLAAVMAQTGQQVVLVDTDLRRPVIHRVFGVPNAAGLTTALLVNPDQETLESLLQPTQVKGLRVLTSGPLPPNPSELLGSHRMSELIESLAAMVDLVIFDSPPVLAVTDAAVLSRQLDGVVLVVDTGETREPLARRAVEELTKVGGRVLGVTLNRLSANNSGGYYYYYYHHYYTEGDGKDSSGGPGDGGAPPTRRLRRETPGTLRSAARRLGALFPMSRSD